MIDNSVVGFIVLSSPWNFYSMDIRGSVSTINALFSLFSISFFVGLFILGAFMSAKARLIRKRSEYRFITGRS